MCLKRYINRLSLIQLTLKGMGILYIVPVVFLFLVLPFLTYLDFAKGYSPEQCYFSTYIMLQIFCPFFAVWWTLFGFREYVEGRIRELLLVYKKSLIVELFLVFVFYFLHICVLLGLYCIILNFNYFNYIFIFFVQTFAFFSISFSISIILKNIAIPFIISVCYEIFCMTANINFFKFINMLSSDIPSSTMDIICPYIFILISSIFVFVLSNSCFKRL